MKFLFAFVFVFKALGLVFFYEVELVFKVSFSLLSVFVLHIASEYAFKVT